MLEVFTCQNDALNGKFENARIKSDRLSGIHSKEFTDKISL